MEEASYIGFKNMRLRNDDRIFIFCGLKCSFKSS